MDLDFGFYSRWSGYATLGIFFFTLLAFGLKWGFRFRLVGITGFMGVLTVGLLGLSLGFLDRGAVEGAVPFSRVYDNGANQIVILVKPDVTPEQVEATLRQASQTYFSYGRGAAQGNRQMLIRARTLIHPQPGQTQPLYLGQLQYTLGSAPDDGAAVTLDKKALAQLAKNQAQLSRQPA
ncbi:MAG: Ycf51 family protein [Cyanobacteriota bacterium]